MRQTFFVHLEVNISPVKPVSLGGIFRAERNFSLSCDFSGKTNWKRQREIPPSGKPA
jgi:hypothetical protein